MNLQEFQRLINISAPQELAEQFLFTDQLAVFDSHSYVSFRSKVSSLVLDTEHIAIVGTGNWRYSLNPEKNFREFAKTSDIDVAVISKYQYLLWWEQMRKNHREQFYLMSYEERQQVRRNGENVYAGFVSPLWIPRCERSIIYNHKAMLNKLSDDLVGHREVKMLFFKDCTEAIDYYRRGFELARRTLK